MSFIQLDSITKTYGKGKNTFQALHGVNLEIKKGDRIVQGIFMPFLITDDDKTTDIRLGGIGSTNKGDDNNE